MDVPQKTIRNMKRKFQRDNDFGMPYHKSDVEKDQRKQFISRLCQNEDFVPTCMANNKKFEEPIRNIIKNFKTFDYVVIVFVGLACGIFSYHAGKSADIKIQSLKQHRDLFAILVATFGLLIGLLLGIGSSVAMEQVNKESSVDKLYNRLSVRLFDVMHEQYPDLDENMLKACNPEMARVIKALLIANMSAEDTREIQSLATEISTLLRNTTPKDEIKTLLNCDAKIKDIMSIVEQNMITNPALQDAIIAVYRGSIPLKFALNNQPKIK